MGNETLHKTTQSNDQLNNQQFEKAVEDWVTISKSHVTQEDIFVKEIQPNVKADVEQDDEIVNSSITSQETNQETNQEIMINDSPKNSLSVKWDDEPNYFDPNIIPLDDAICFDSKKLMELIKKFDLDQAKNIELLLSKNDKRMKTLRNSTNNINEEIQEMIKMLDKKVMRSNMHVNEYANKFITQQWSNKL